jgi:hypothetical protein
MNELIERIVANVGLEPAGAKQAVGLILGFLQAEGPADEVAKLMGALPGASEAIAEANYKPGFMSGVMGLGSQLMAMGMGMGEITGVSKETIRFAREKAGDGPIDAVVASIPGLSQFV